MRRAGLAMFNGVRRSMSLAAWIGLVARSGHVVGQSQDQATYAKPAFTFLDRGTWRTLRVAWRR